MKTRIWMTAAVAIGALTFSMPAAAADDHAVAAAAGAGEGAGIADTVASQELIKETKVLQEAGAFLGPMNVGNHMKYVEYPLGDMLKNYPGLHSPIGQLQVKRDGITMTADVVNFTVPKDMGNGSLSGLFTLDKEGKPSAEGTLKVLLFNQFLEKAPAFFNEKILEGVSLARKQTGEPIPYSIMHVDFRSVEPLHRMKGDRIVYTTGSRVLLYVDGWIFPMYMKAYLYKEGNDYRAIGLFAADSVKTEAIEGGNELIHKLTGVK